MNVTTLYECPECGEVHNFAVWAERCCPPAAAEVYKCGKCGDIYDHEDSAEECCSEEKTK